MPTETFRGRVVPLRVAEHPGLEVCNTRAGWGEPTPTEYLTDYDALLAWTSAVGIIDPATADHLGEEAARNPSDADRALADVLTFRDDLYAFLTRPAATAKPIESWFKRAVRASTLAADPSGRWVWDAAGGLHQPAWHLVHSAAAMLSDHPAAAVHRCPGTGCGWLFLDLAGRRRWCVMAICGNRAKARRRAAMLRENSPQAPITGSSS